MNPLELVGPAFLGFYLSLLIAATVAALAIRRALREPSEETSWESKPLDVYQAAYLAGGANRTSLSALASLVNSGVLEVQSDGRVVWTGREYSPSGLHPVEKGVLKNLCGTSVKIDRAGEGVSDSVRESLLERGLLVGENTAAAVQWISAAPLFLLLALGATKLFVGVSRGRPVGFLVVLCGVTAILGLILLCKRPQRSRLGDKLLARVKRESAAVGYAARGSLGALSGPDVALAVGLFGVTAMAGDSFANLRRAASPNGGSGCGVGGSGCGGGGGGCGGGGCGGGGCGGCGS